MGTLRIVEFLHIVSHPKKNSKRHLLLWDLENDTKSDILIQYGYILQDTLVVCIGGSMLLLLAGLATNSILVFYPAFLSSIPLGFCLLIFFNSYHKTKTRLEIYHSGRKRDYRLQWHNNVWRFRPAYKMDGTMYNEWLSSASAVVNYNSYSTGSPFGPFIPYDSGTHNTYKI